MENLLILICYAPATTAEAMWSRVFHIYLFKTDVGGSNIISVPGQYKVNAKKNRIKYDRRSQGRHFPFSAFLGTFYYVKCLNFTQKNQIFFKKS